MCLVRSGQAVPVREAGSQDREAAIHWFTLAAEQGSEYARFLLNRMEDWQKRRVARRGAAAVPTGGRYLSRTGSR